MTPPAPAAPALTRSELDLFEKLMSGAPKWLEDSSVYRLIHWARAADEALGEIEARVADGYVSSSREMGMLLSIARAARLATTPEKGGA